MLEGFFTQEVRNFLQQVPILFPRKDSPVHVPWAVPSGDLPLPLSCLAASGEDMGGLSRFYSLPTACRLRVQESLFSLNSHRSPNPGSWFQSLVTFFDLSAPCVRSHTDNSVFLSQFSCGHSRPIKLWWESYALSYLFQLKQFSGP